MPGFLAEYLLATASQPPPLVYRASRLTLISPASVRAAGGVAAGLAAAAVGAAVGCAGGAVGAAAAAVGAAAAAVGAAGLAAAVGAGVGAAGAAGAAGAGVGVGAAGAAHAARSAAPTPASPARNDRRLRTICATALPPCSRRAHRRGGWRGGAPGDRLHAG